MKNMEKFHIELLEMETTMTEMKNMQNGINRILGIEEGKISELEDKAKVYKAKQKRNRKKKKNRVLVSWHIMSNAMGIPEGDKKGKGGQIKI